jgi:hypothetical protein
MASNGGHATRAEFAKTPLRSFLTWLEGQAAPRVAFPHPKIGEHIWIQRAREDGTTSDFTNEFYVGTVTRWETLDGHEYVVTDGRGDGGTWWPDENMPGTYVRVVAWGLVEPEPETVTLEHREGEYVHLNTSRNPVWQFTDGAWEIIHSDLYRWYVGSKGHGVATPETMTLWVEDGIVSHGFLAPGKTLLEVPEVGRWIRATTADGKTHEVEVKANNKNSLLTFLGTGSNNGNSLFVNPDIPDPDKKRHIVSWVYVEPPRKVKWPAGATLQGRYSKSLFTLDADVYEGDELATIRGEGKLLVADLQRVEVKVID